MVAMLQNKLLTFFGSCEEYFGVMLLHKSSPLFRFFTYDDAFGMIQHHAKQSANACGTRSNYQYSVAFCNL